MSVIWLRDFDPGRAATCEKPVKMMILRFGVIFSHDHVIDTTVLNTAIPVLMSGLDPFEGIVGNSHEGDSENSQTIQSATDPEGRTARQQRDHRTRNSAH